MKELLDKSLQLIPRYVAQLIDVIIGPKRFITRLNIEREDALQDALLFFGLSLLISFVLQARLMPKGEDAYLAFAQLVALELVVMLASVIVLRISWALVGGSASFRALFICSAYIIVPMLFCLLSFVLIGDALFRMADPELYNAVRREMLIDPSRLWSSPGFLIDILLVALGFLAMSLQYIVAWGAYRKLNRTSKLRSTIAFVVSTLLFIPLTAGALLMSWHVQHAPTP